MASNKRIFYAIQQFGLKSVGDAGAFTEVHGLQSAGITTNFNLIQVFEYGKISLYANIEELPDVQITVSKVIDGYPLIYHLATLQATTPTLVGRSTASCVAALAIFPDTNTRATGTPPSQVTCSGQFVGSVSYSFTVDGNGTEDVTLAGNNKLWANDSRIALGASAPSFVGAFSDTDSPPATGGIVRRNSVQFATSVTTGDVNNRIADPDCTILPVSIFGIDSSGRNIADANGYYAVHMQSAKFSVDLNRQQINEFGHLGPYTRFPNFPVEVTSEFSVISVSGDMVSAAENGILSTGVGCGNYLGNLSNETIRFATCDGTRIYCGTKNKLKNVSSAGGDTGGGNVTDTYTYSNFNDFTVISNVDPNSTNFWATRSTYLIN